MSYQGQLSTNGTPFDGTAQFKFVIFDNDDVSLWSNDGTSTGGQEPQGSVTLAVSHRSSPCTFSVKWPAGTAKVGSRSGLLPSWTAGKMFRISVALNAPSATSTHST